MDKPKHIAIIMDGNGRWAKKRGLPRIAGHQRGVQAVREIVKSAGKLGVEALTLFAFSSENKNRSDEEVSLLFKLFLTVLKQEVGKLNKYNVSLKIIGDLSIFPNEVQEKAAEAQAMLAHNSGLRLIIAANYGGRWDLAQAAKQLAGSVQSGQLNLDDVNEHTLGQYMSLADEPTLDLMIRTSGEQRLSNFLLWDCAYSEFYFTDKLWPDFTEADLIQAIDTFTQRDRRFGARDKEATC